jgi:hypothetical protein
LALTTAISSTSARAYTRKNTGKHPAILDLPFVGQREQGDKANGGNSFCPQHTCITYDTHSRKLSPSAICRLFCSFNVRAMQTLEPKVCAAEYWTADMLSSISKTTQKFDSFCHQPGCSTSLMLGQRKPWNHLYVQQKVGLRIARKEEIRHLQ